VTAYPFRHPGDPLLCRFSLHLLEISSQGVSAEALPDAETSSARTAVFALSDMKLQRGSKRPA
jgi:hypothetical protein